MATVDIPFWGGEGEREMNAQLRRLEETERGKNAPTNHIEGRPDIKEVIEQVRAQKESDQKKARGLANLIRNNNL